MAPFDIYGCLVTGAFHWDWVTFGEKAAGSERSACVLVKMFIFRQNISFPAQVVKKTKEK